MVKILPNILKSYYKFLIYFSFDSVLNMNECGFWLWKITYKLGTFVKLQFARHFPPLFHNSPVLKAKLQSMRFIFNFPMVNAKFSKEIESPHKPSENLQIFWQKFKSCLNQVIILILIKSLQIFRRLYMVAPHLSPPLKSWFP